jgi:hypothetical protein
MSGADVGGKAFLKALGQEADFKQYYSIADKNFEYIEIGCRAKATDFMEFYRSPGFYFSQKLNELISQYHIAQNEHIDVKLAKKVKVLGQYYWYIFDDQSQLVDIKNSVFNITFKGNKFEMFEKTSFDTLENFIEFRREKNAHKVWRMWPNTVSLIKEAAQYDILHVPYIRINCLLVSERLLQKMEENKITGYEIFLEDCQININ